MPSGVYLEHVRNRLPLLVDDAIIIGDEVAHEIASFPAQSILVNRLKAAISDRHSALDHDGLHPRGPFRDRRVDARGAAGVRSSRKGARYSQTSDPSRVVLRL